MFGMRFLMKAVVCLLPVCAGCGILGILIFGFCEVFPGYNVRGTVLDAETSAPISAAQVSLQLLRVGEVIGGMTTTQTNTLGEFEDGIPFDMHTCDFPPELLLGDPPDELQVVVQVDGADGELLVLIAPDAITIESPGFGLIELTPFEISLVSP